MRMGSGLHGLLWREEENADWLVNQLPSGLTLMRILHQM
jgi:hypothetical protein